MLNPIVRQSSLAVAALLLGACRQPPQVDRTPAAAPSLHSAELEAAPRPMVRDERRRGGCETLIDAEGADTLRFVREGLVLYANEQMGVAVVDVSNADEPKVIGLSEMTGTPVGVFAVKDAAIVVFSPWDRPGVTIVRAFSLGPDGAGRVLGERELSGTARDARRVGDFVVVTRETPSGRTSVSTFTTDAMKLSARDEIELLGASAVTGGSPRGVAVARVAVPALGPDRTAVTWLGIDPDTGTLALQGTATVNGVVPRWRGGERVINVTEDSVVRLVTCASAACPVDGAAAFASVDFSLPDSPRTTAWSLLARAGDGVVGFDGSRLVVARPTVDRSDSTDLVFFRTERELVPAGTVRLRGTVGTIVVRDTGDVVTVGWTGSASAGKRAIIHHVDARNIPRLVGAATFGGDWTWTRAYEDDRVIGFDPRSMLAALPMTTLRGKLGPTSAAQVLSFDPSGPRAVEETSVAADRLLFVDGRLLAFSADGVIVVRREGEQGAERRWHDLRP